MLAHVPSFGRNPRGSPDFLAYPVPKACMHVLGSGVLRCSGVARSASSPKAAIFGRAVLRCSFGGPHWCRLRCCLAWGFARLLLSWAASWLCVCLLPHPLFFLLCAVCLFSFFFSGPGSACSSLCLLCAGTRTGWHRVWLTGLLLMLALGWAAPRPHGSGRICTGLAWGSFLSG